SRSTATRAARTTASSSLLRTPSPGARSLPTAVLKRRPVTDVSVPGYFGPYGGRFVAETLVPALEELALAMTTVMQSDGYTAELGSLLTHYVGRPTPLPRAERLASFLDPDRATLEVLGLKREDLCHTGAHKINNALGQVVLARRMGK